ncbi:hypothetical protein KKB40_00815 [Patescibacteria group bacterium]|nr:hypothetical protein [Patescibacteria group bacterium]
MSAKGYFLALLQLNLFQVLLLQTDLPNLFQRVSRLFFIFIFPYYLLRRRRMDKESLLRGIDSGYILATLVAIGFLLAYIATKLQNQKKPSKR